MLQTKLDVKRVIVLIVIISLIVGAVSYGIGFSNGMNWSITIGLKFLKMKGINIDVDEGMLRSAISQYKNSIDGCWGDENASVHS